MEPDQDALGQTIERIEALETLAERILGESRISLMMSFRFLDRALWKMPFKSLRFAREAPLLSISTRTSLSTDGTFLYYNAKAVIAAFRQNPDLVTRSYLHALLHCVFRHPFKTMRAEPDLWSLACDICIETIALEMCDGRFALEGDQTVRSFAERITALCSGITPGKVYRALLLGKREGASAEQMRLYAELNGQGGLFARDDHHLWDLSQPPSDTQPPQSPAGDDYEPDAGDPPEQPSDRQSANPGDAPDDSGTESAQDAEMDADSPEPENSGENGRDDRGPIDDQGTPDDDAPLPQRDVDAGELELAETDAIEAADTADDSDEEDWEQISRQIETDLRTLGKERGSGAGSFVGNLALANRSKVDYADFLRRFATRAEEAVPSDEEFDYVFYTYGLKLYGNMPLVEPLEYTETERVREFVIAIDTSGSCSQGLTRAFITRTYEILSHGQAFDERVNVHIVQCDAEVQSVETIRDIGDLATYEREFEVRGYGGTDFRPVFAYVDELIANREFHDLQGLVYFTDGYGIFPAQAPGYDVAFVFVEEEGKDRRVPPWAMKVVLEEDSIYEMEAKERP